MIEPTINNVAVTNKAIVSESLFSKLQQAKERADSTALQVGKNPNEKRTARKLTPKPYTQKACGAELRQAPNL